MPERKSYVVKREKELVIRSSVIEAPAYANLKKLLHKYDRIDDQIIAEDTDFDPTTVHILKNTFPAIVQNAASEWEYIKEVAQKSRCMLDNVKIATQYFIHNQLTDGELVVGSECIKKFAFRNGVSSIPTITFIQKQHKEQQKIVRSNEISESYGHINSILLEHRQKLDNSPLILPWEVFTAFKCLIDAIETYQTQYINGKLPLDSLREFRGALDAADQYSKNHVDKWLANHTHDFFAGTLQDADFLRQINKLEVLDEIRKNGGSITQDTVHHLGYIGFIHKNLNAFNKKLVSIFEAITVLDTCLYIRFRNKAIARLDYTMTPADFMQLFGFVLFEQDIVEFCFDGVYPKCRYVDSERNLWELIDLVHIAMENKYELLYDEARLNFYIRSGTKYCDTLTASALAKYLVPHIINQKNPANIESLYFNRLKWTALADLDTASRQIMEQTFLKLKSKGKDR